VHSLYFQFGSLKGKMYTLLYSVFVMFTVFVLMLVSLLLLFRVFLVFLKGSGEVINLEET